MIDSLAYSQMKPKSHETSYAVKTIVDFPIGTGAAQKKQKEKASQQ
jgi:hypothetical protein